MVVMVRIGVETECMFEDGIQRMGGQSELRPVRIAGR